MTSNNQDSTSNINFNQKGAKMYKSFETLALSVLEGDIPTDPKHLRAHNRDGRTISHMLARHGEIPTSDEYWHIADKKGWSVAHEAARYRNLPEGFSLWHIKDNTGYTVAHEAARSGCLQPKNFESWDELKAFGIVEKHGISAAQTLEIIAMNALDDFEHSGNLSIPSVEHLNIGDLQNSLSEYFDRYGIADITRIKVAQIAHQPVYCFAFMPKKHARERLGNFLEKYSFGFMEKTSVSILTRQNLVPLGPLGEDDYCAVIPIEEAVLMHKNIIELLSRTLYEVSGQRDQNLAELAQIIEDERNLPPVFVL